MLSRGGKKEKMNVKALTRVARSLQGSQDSYFEVPCLLSSAA